MSKPRKTSKYSKASRFIGPEDVRRGDYVTITHTTCQVLPCDMAVTGGRDVEPIRVRALSEIAGWPLKVIGVCLPFVTTVDADGDHWTLDFRRHELARVARSYGQATFKSVRAAAKGRRK